MQDETLAVHAGRVVDPTTGAVVPPLHLSTNFERDRGGAFTRGYSYIREANPNRDALEVCLRELEGGASAIAVASGMAAAFAVLQTLGRGERIVVSRDVYYGVRDLVVDYFARWGIEHAFVDARDADALRAACTPGTKLVWIETPSNPLIEIIDIAACAEVAHATGARLVVENTFASPIVQRPFDHAADVVVHSLTKYLAGHSDVMGGAVIVKEDLAFAKAVRTAQKLVGAVLSPFDAFLTMRGIETLAARIRAHNENALMLARFLAAHPAVERVHYPGLPGDPGHAVARKQMRGFGGMLSFEVRGGREEAFAVAARLELITRATSLGGTHSLIEHRASIEGPLSRAPESLLRLSVGIEHVDDLVADLDQALAPLVTRTS
jgi:cystathionine gamma-synthase